MKLNNEYMSTREVREALGVNKETLYRWLESGRLRGIRVTPTSNYIIRRDEFEATFGSTNK